MTLEALSLMSYMIIIYIHLGGMKEKNEILNFDHGPMSKNI